MGTIFSRSVPCEILSIAVARITSFTCNVFLFYLVLKTAYIRDLAKTLSLFLINIWFIVISKSKGSSKEVDQRALKFSTN